MRVFNFRCICKHDTYHKKVGEFWEVAIIAKTKYLAEKNFERFMYESHAPLMELIEILEMDGFVLPKNYDRIIRKNI